MNSVSVYLKTQKHISPAGEVSNRWKKKHLFYFKMVIAAMMKDFNPENVFDLSSNVQKEIHQNVQNQWVKKQTSLCIINSRYAQNKIK